MFDTNICIYNTYILCIVSFVSIMGPFAIVPSNAFKEYGECNRVHASTNVLSQPVNQFMDKRTSLKSNEVNNEFKQLR